MIKYEILFRISKKQYIFKLHIEMFDMEMNSKSKVSSKNLTYYILFCVFFFCDCNKKKSNAKKNNHFVC